MADQLLEFDLDTQKFVDLLRNLVGVAESLQNSGIQGLFAREDNASDFVLKALEPYTVPNGGPLVVERVSFVEGRGNVIITYPGTTDQTVAIVGCHMDVVPANPEGWDRDPFTLEVEGDKLYGRGTTDCLGHVALVTDLFLQLAKAKPTLRRTVVGVLIANEEDGYVEGIGVDALMASGKIDSIKNGPILWVDCADSQPCIGTAGSIVWKLKATGKLFHSGLPHKGINALELAMDAITEIQRRFYVDFRPHPLEGKYNYACTSTMKPTQIEVSKNGVNQIPPWAVVSGDIRLIPFYEASECIKTIEKYVAELNENMASLSNLEARGPSRYVLPDGNIKEGRLEISFGAGIMEGIACNLESLAYQAIFDAVRDVKNSCTPYSISGSLPLVRDLQRNGFDVQLIGFGHMSTYHADNEYCSLSDMKDGFRILTRFIRNVESS